MIVCSCHRLSHKSSGIVLTSRLSRLVTSTTYGTLIFSYYYFLPISRPYIQILEVLVLCSSFQFHIKNISDDDRGRLLDVSNPCTMSGEVRREASEDTQYFAETVQKKPATNAAGSLLNKSYLKPLSKTGNLRRAYLLFKFSLIIWPEVTFTDSICLFAHVLSQDFCCLLSGVALHDRTFNFHNSLRISRKVCIRLLQSPLQDYLYEIDELILPSVFYAWKCSSLPHSRQSLMTSWACFRPLRSL